MVGRGEKISTKGAKVSVQGAKDESAKGSQGVGKDSKGVREGPRRKTFGRLVHRQLPLQRGVILEACTRLLARFLGRM